MSRQERISPFVRAVSGSTLRLRFAAFEYNACQDEGTVLVGCPQFAPTLPPPRSGIASGYGTILGRLCLVLRHKLVTISDTCPREMVLIDGNWALCRSEEFARKSIDNSWLRSAPIYA